MYGEGATYDSIEGRFRIIKKDAAKMKAEAVAGGAVVGRKGRAPKTVKKKVQQGVLTGRVTKVGAGATKGKGKGKVMGIGKGKSEEGSQEMPVEIVEEEVQEVGTGNRNGNGVQVRLDDVEEFARRARLVVDDEGEVVDGGMNEKDIDDGEGDMEGEEED